MCRGACHQLLEKSDMKRSRFKAVLIWLVLPIAVLTAAVSCTLTQVRPSDGRLAKMMQSPQWRDGRFHNTLGNNSSGSLGSILVESLTNDAAYLDFPRAALFDRIGMRNTVPGVDRFGDFVLSSQVYTNARDLARLGLLYLNEGQWNGEQILSRDWIEFSRSPAASSARTFSAACAASSFLPD